jgi:RsiW-degrading membrane proteinase PrsW (M82 family)
VVADRRLSDHAIVSAADPACPHCGSALGKTMRFCPSCGIRLLSRADSERDKPAAPTGSAKTDADRPSLLAEIRRFCLLVLAVAIPLGIVLLIVTVQPSVLREPELYFVYALLEATLFLLVFRLFDLYEREPLSVLALMAVWGGTIALALAVIGNAAFDRSLPRPVDAVFGAAITAPIVEESAKGAALLAAFLVSSWANKRYGLLKFDGLTDGLLYGAAVGLGFAFVEDILYFVNSSYLHGVGAGMKVFLLRTSFLKLNMLLHPLATGAFGAGLGLATWSRTRLGRFGFPVIGLTVAMLTHAVWNGFDELVLVHRYGWNKTSAWFTTGVDSELAARMERTFTHADQIFHIVWYVFIGLWILAVALWLRHQRNVISLELGDEVRWGTLSRSELDQLLHSLERSRSYWRLLLAGRFEEWRLSRRLHSELVELAFLKWRLGGEPAGESQLSRRRHGIASLRSELAVVTSDAWVAA